MTHTADSTFRLDADFFDYAIVALYFVVVLGIGVIARRRV
ncbi:MAG: Na+/galactose cotransporter, partial [Aeromicrobium sp.]|nr:Na+/galactose cotransporter [Aeromicrobium sp.]